MAKDKSKRLLSVDILRGITIAGMLLVNNPGTWSDIYTPLKHADWIGLTPTDLVFPFFMFVMGVSMYFSLRKFQFRLSRALLWKVVRRTVLLMVIGWAVHWFAHLMYALARGESFLEAANSFATMRIMGVFQRLALCYFFGSLLAVLVRHRWLPGLITLILVAYALILQFGHGYEVSAHNVIAVVDNEVLGDAHMYHDGLFSDFIAFDPEGLVSTLPCIAHVLIGLLVGKMLIERHDNSDRTMRLLLWGGVLVLAGWLLQYGIPCGKKIWSSTYVLITCGMAASILGMLVYVIDIRGHRRWCRFFEVFGVNPLALYLLGSVLSIVFGAVALWTGADGARVTIHSLIHDAFLAVSCPKTASLLYALAFVGINWLCGLPLYKKKIYIKI